jgi:hypothetical protein
MSNIFSNPQAFQPQPQPVPVPTLPNSIPILARVIPVDVNYNQLGNEFIAYVYSTSSVSLVHPSYSTLCTREPIMPSNVYPGNSNSDIETFKQTQLKPLLDKMNELNAFMTKLWNNVNDQNESMAEVDSDTTEKSIDSTPKEEETPQFKMPNFPEFTSPLPSSNPIDEEPGEQSGSSNLMQIQITPFHLKNSNHAGGVNVNINSGGIFQCEGVTCPNDAVTCRVTINAIEPEYNELLTTVACLSSDNKVLHQAQSKSENPNKGIDHHVSRTHSRGGIPRDMAKMQHDFQDKMKNTFNNNFFKNPFMNNNPFFHKNKHN